MRSLLCFLFLVCALTTLVQGQIEEVDIVVIGAGVAGIKAARDAIDAGYTVVILEAQNRYGGRIMTHRFTGIDRPVEMGAMWYHSGNYNSMLDLADECGIDLQIYDHDDSKVWENSQKLNAREVGQLVSDYVTAWANADPFSQTGRSDQDAFLLGGYVPNRRVETIRRYADEQIYGDNAEHHDSLGWQDLTDEGVDRFSPEGFDLILDCMLDKTPSLRPFLRLNSIVKKIKYEMGGGKSQLIYIDDGQDNDDCDSEDFPRKKITARKGVIFTAGIGVMKRRRVNFVPDLSVNHWNSIDIRLFGPITKMAVSFDSVGMNELRKAKYAANYLFRICDGSEPRFELKPYIFINHQYLTGAPLLNSFDQGYVSSNFSQMSENQLKTIFMTSVREIIPSLPEPTFFKVQHWGEENHIWGGYSDYGLGALENDWSIWESPLGNSRNLWFAGEGYTSQNVLGTTSSSFFSAQTTVAQIVSEDN